MIPQQKLMKMKQARDLKLSQAQQLIGRGRYPEAETAMQQILKEWRQEGGPKEEEHSIILPLGKSMEAQRKFVEAYELYMNALNSLTGQAYDEVYSQFLYLNQKMGAFDKKPDLGY